MICRLSCESIKNLDSNQLKVLSYFENHFGENIRVISLIKKHQYNPIQIIIKQDDEYQAFMSCREHEGPFYLCSFQKIDKDELIKISQHYLELTKALNFHKMQ